MDRKNILLLIAVCVLGLTVLFSAGKVFAHCDTMDGPVVKAAQTALETGNISLVLIWVSDKREKEVKEAFEKAIAVRKLSPEAKSLADMFFFETVVRVHRTDEGASYTGIKKPGEKLSSIVMAADKSLELSKIEPLMQVIKDAVCEGIHTYFKAVNDRKNYDPDDVAAGREFVEAYVAYIHYVEGVYDIAKNPGEGHCEKDASKHPERHKEGHN